MHLKRPVYLFGVGRKKSIVWVIEEFNKKTLVIKMTSLNGDLKCFMTFNVFEHGLQDGSIDISLEIPYASRSRTTCH